jgi:hypothetical protein
VTSTPATHVNVQGDAGRGKGALYEAYFNENGELANNNKGNIQVFEKHLHHVYNHQKPRHPPAAELIKQSEVMTEMGDPISWAEFNKAITKLKNDKSPGEDGVPPNTFKCLHRRNKLIIFEFICAFWDGEKDYDEQTLTQIRRPQLPPQVQRGVALMDVLSKIFSSILAERAFKLLAKHGIKQQFGGTPLVGCADGLFTLKTLLHLRRQHNLPSYVMFVDPVKAHDTVN